MDNDKRTGRLRRLIAGAAAVVSSVVLLSPGAAQAASGTRDLADEAACRSNLPAAEDRTGHAYTRFDWCRLLEFDRRPIIDTSTGQEVAWFSGYVTIYGTADRGTRNASFTINLKNVVVTSDHDKSYIGIATSCTAITNVTCSGATNVEQDIDDWEDNASTLYTVNVSSPNDTGVAPYFETYTQVTTHLVFGIRDGRTTPGGGDFSLANVRFDSANNKMGNGPFHGTVFSDNIPKLQLSAAPGSIYREEALHVYDAINRPVRTFPSFVGKSPPTRLTRYMGDVNNTDEARKICVDVWGRDYSQPPGLPGPDPNRLDCDEYPFSSTYQGARLATTSHEYPNGNWRTWHGSARPIPWQQNQDGGNALGQFYGAHRLLDGDAFDVSATL